MPRTKGSKNKPKTVTADFATQIAEKQSAKETLSAEIASITANIDSLKADLKEKKASLKAIDKEIVKLEAKKEKADAKAAEEVKKAHAESCPPSTVSVKSVLLKMLICSILSCATNGASVALSLPTASFSCPISTLTVQSQQAMT